MPLKLLKRTSKQYNVVSKTTFVISVELLDNGIMECTLDADSTGRDCLLNISQRLGLHQPEFFGLRYISRGVPPRERWLELDRPLKKQLEKHAQDSQLSLGVMFYVGDVDIIGNCRYHYYLQLKRDVIDGKLNCNMEQAIQLAAYSLQAEFGDYDPERHTTEYLRDFAILPKELMNDEKYADINLDALPRQYGSLVGFPSPLAEIYYVMLAQQLDGYGQEAFSCQDDAGNDICLCVSLNGLVIRRRDWTHVAVFRWSDIKALIGHKRLFVVEKVQSQRTMQFHFTDPEVAKYVRKMCILQSTFYKEHISTENLNDSHRNHNFSGNHSDQIDGGSHLGVVGINMRSTPDLIAPSLARNGGSQYSLNNNTSTCFSAIPSTSSSNLSSSSGFNLHLLQHSSSPSTSTAHQMKQGLLNTSNSSTNQQHFHELPLGRPFTPSLSLMPDLSTSSTQMTQHNHNLASMSVNLTPSSDDLQNIQSLLPSYRPAPDYDTAIQHKYGHSHQHGHHGVSVVSSVVPPSSTQIYFDGQSNNDNQNEEEPIYQNEIVSQMHSIELRDSLQKTQQTIESVAKPSLSKTSNQTTSEQETVPEDPNMHMYKPPPPYPGGGKTKFDNQQNKLPVSNAPTFHQHQNNNQGNVGVVVVNKGANKGINNNQQSALEESSSTPAIAACTTTASKSTTATTTITTNTAGCEKIVITGNAVAQPQVSPSINTTSFFSKGTSSARSSGASSSGQGNSDQHNIKSIKEESITVSTPSSSSSTSIKINSGQSLGKKKDETKISNSSINQSNISSTAVESSTSITTSPGGTSVTTLNSSASSVSSSTPKCKHGVVMGLSPHKQQKPQKRGTPASETIDKNEDGKLYGKPIDAAILQEYQAIRMVKSNPNFTTALKSENSKRNRCPDVLPYEDNLIRLTPSRLNPDGYVNASPISAHISGRDWKYIVGQIPFGGNSVWQMIWETSTKIIAVLERDSTAPFYPPDSSSSLVFNDFHIAENKERSNSATTIARELILTYTPKKKQRKVWVLPYETEWKNGVPIHTEHFLCFVEEVNLIQRKVSDSSAPLAVLCFKGAGRSGVFLLADLLLHAADSGQKLRCDNLLAELRNQRMALVSSPAQYAFVLSTLEKYLAQSRLI